METGESGQPHVEQAYAALGLGVTATIGEVEKRYEGIIRKLRSKQIRGALTAEDEAEMKRASAAYREILNEQNRKLTEQYRASRYGRFKRWAGLAEKADHFLSYRRFEIFAVLLLLGVFALGSAVIETLNADHAATAEFADADLTVVLAGTGLPEQGGLPSSAQSSAVELEWLRLAPGWEQIETRFIPFPGAEAGDRTESRESRAMQHRSEIALLSENPDLYIVDRANFIRLARLGFLAKLEEWDAYGVDVSEGGAAVLKRVPFRPAIAAIPVNAVHKDNALRVIHALLAAGDGAHRERYKQVGNASSSQSSMISRLETPSSLRYGAWFRK